MNKQKDPNFIVPLTSILEINPHPNPKVENLLIAKVYDFDVIISKHSQYKVGSKVVYFPVNSILPNNIESFLFPPDSKIKLEKSRIKAVRIQKCVSYGLLASWEDIKIICKLSELPLETDLQELIKVIKYYPPAKVMNETVGAPKEKTPRNKKGENEYFKKYNGCTNLKWVPYAFTDEDDVYITEKIHGSNLRVGHVPVKLKFTFWQRVKKFFGIKVIVDTHEYCYGSNNVQRQNNQSSETFYKKDVYAQIIDKYNLKQILENHLGYVIYGEIYGPTIQKGYHYGLKNDQIEFVMFDVLEQKENDQRWLSAEELKEFANKHNIPMVPVLYEGKWNKEMAINLATGNSIFHPAQKVIEGVVVKNSNVYSLNRNKIKIINPEYTMKEATGETTDEQEIE